MRKLLLLVLFLALVSAVTARPQINTGTNQGLVGVKIAVPDFQPASADASAAGRAALFNQVLRNDLSYSGGVTVVSPSLYPLGKFSGPGDIKPDDWTTAAVGAQFIAFGNLRTANGGLAVEARLWDLKAASASGREALAQRINSEDSDEGARLTAHQLADMIIDLIGGGAKGIARTKIAYISERTPGIKDLYVMDYDGNDPHAVTAYKSLVLTPAWSPDGEKLAFTSYRKGVPDIEVLSRIDNRPYTFDRPGGNTFTPAWSPDGSKIAFATSRDGGGPEIYTADWNGKNLHRLTMSKGSNNSPVWNPKTGREIAFISDRSGTPQIYVMDADGTNVRRLIEEGGHADEPAWSPDGERIAFAWQRLKTSNFDIYIHDLASGKNVQITSDARDNERPTWAPDGRHLAFESTRKGGKQIFTMLLDGSQVQQLTTTGKNSAPAWSGFLK
ncbi:MAG TPA: Tol-Pal system beta propeller repeat protein TolB [Terriglobia bacterium]|jgi:TolB protein